MTVAVKSPCPAAPVASCAQRVSVYIDPNIDWTSRFDIHTYVSEVWSINACIFYKKFLVVQKVVSHVFGGTAILEEQPT